MMSVETIGLIAESVGLDHLADSVAEELVIQVNFWLKAIIQDGAKFMHHSKRSKLTTSDVNHSLKLKQMEPFLGFSNPDVVPFCFVSGGGTQLFLPKTDIVPTNSIESKMLPPSIPVEVSFRTHWLCIDGIQPLIPENPPPS